MPRKLLTLLTTTAVAAAVVLLPAAAHSSPTTGFSLSDASVTEGDTNYTNVAVQVTRTSTIGTASVRVSTLDGSAKAAILTNGLNTNGGDYEALTPGVVSFADGQRTTFFTIKVFGDTLKESDEIIYTRLTAPSGAQILDGLGTVTIKNDDTVETPNGFGVGDVTAPAQSGVANVPIFRYGPKTGSASVTVSTLAGGTAQGCHVITDGPACAYVPVSSKVVSFSNSQAVQMVPITLFDNSKVIGNQTVEVGLSNPTGDVIYDRGTGTVTILPVITPTAGFEISDAAVQEGNSGMTTMTFTITRHGPINTNAALTWTTAPGTATSTDFVPVTTPAPLKFLQGDFTKTITVQIIGDTVVEPDETFTVKLAAYSNCTLNGCTGPHLIDGTGTGTIVNDD